MQKLRAIPKTSLQSTLKSLDEKYPMAVTLSVPHCAVSARLQPADQAMQLSHITPGHCVWFWSRGTLKNWGESSKVGGGKCTKMVMGLETLAHKERLKGLGSFSLEKRGRGGISSLSFSAGNVEMMKALSSW